MPLMKKMRQSIHDTKSILSLAVQNRYALQIIAKVRSQKLTYLEWAALAELYQVVKDVEVSEQTGIIVEAGVALGGSAIVLAAAKSPQRPLFLYDAFEMIPAPTDGDGPDAHERYQKIKAGQAVGIKGDDYYGYQPDLLERVIQVFHDLNLPPTANMIHFVKGYYEDTLLVEEPVAVAHIDCDWYSSVIRCLEQIVPNLVVGGTLIIDDYEAWSGCRRAVDEYFEGRQKEFEFVMKSRLHITRCR
jgi:O-methyltransferase